MRVQIPPYTLAFFGVFIFRVTLSLMFGLLVSSAIWANPTVDSGIKADTAVTDKELLAACDINGDLVIKGLKERSYEMELDKKEIAADKKETEKLKNRTIVERRVARMEIAECGAFR